MAAGAVNFNPDASKGNTSKFTPSGRIQSGGAYSVNTENKVGAPAGWYKVTIITSLPGSPPGPVVVNSRYASIDTTPLAVQVAENAPADAYDLKLTK